MSDEQTDSAPGPSARTRAAVVGLFFLSGISGLIYQVIWVRAFGLVFGNTVHSASLVTAVFMLGLGVGSWWIGRLGDRRYGDDARAPLRLYALAELVIAGLGLLLAFCVPELARLGAKLSSYSIDDNGWHVLSTGSHLMRYVVAAIVLAPPALVMGGTLTLLIRFLVAGQLDRTGWRVGLLYGFNTAGAASGALLTDFALVPLLGIFATQLFAVGLNLAAGLGALALVRRLPATEATDATEPPPNTDSDAGTAGSPRAVSLTAVALLLSGFAAMGIEITWFRYLGQVLGAMRSVFSLLLAVILVGMFVGSTLGGRLQRRWGEPATILLVAQGVFVAITIGLLVGFDHHGAFYDHLAAVRDPYLAAEGSSRAFIALGANLRPIALVAFLPSVFMGLTFPLANAHIQRVSSAVGQRAGTLYLFNTLGNLLGSLVAGFVLLPALGIRTALLILGAAGALATVPLWLSAVGPDEWSQPGRRSYAFLASALLAGLSLFAFSVVDPERLLLPAIPRGDEGGTRGKLTVSEGLNETLVVVEVPGVERALFTNGHPMSSTSAISQRYMRAFVHVPLLHQEKPTDALVICFGVGNTLHAASLHPSIERIEVADLSRHVLEHAHYFEASNAGVLNDERVSVFVNDGRHHLLLQPEARYDLITLEPPPITFAGVASLYSRDFYSLARSRLRAGGFVTQWLPIYQVPRDVVLAMVRAFVEVFPQSILLSGDDHELILMGHKAEEAIELDPKLLAERLEARPDVARDLTRIYMGGPVDFFGAFASSSAVLHRAVEGAPIVTDDRPVLEYGQPVNIQRPDLPPGLFDVGDIGAWCRRCRATLDGLEGYLAVRDRLYRSEAFLTGGSVSFDAPQEQAAIRAHPYLRYLVEGQSYHLKQLGQAHLERQDAAAAAGAFRRALFYRPDDPDALFGLAKALAQAGRAEQANELLGKVVAIAPQHPGANAIMCLEAVRRRDAAEARLRCQAAEKGGFAPPPALRAKIDALLAR